MTRPNRLQRHRARIRQMWQAGASLDEIGEKFGSGAQSISSTISKWRRQDGPAAWPKRLRTGHAGERFDAKAREAIRQRLLAGETVKALAADYGVAASTMSERIGKWRAADGEERWPRFATDRRGPAGQKTGGEEDGADDEAEALPEMETPRSIAAVRGGRRIRLMKQMRGLNNDIVYVVTAQRLPHGNATCASSANVVMAREICATGAEAARVFAMFWRAAARGPECLGTGPRADGLCTERGAEEPQHEGTENAGAVA